MSPGRIGVVYFDENGRRHREELGSNKLAVGAYQKRKNEIPENQEHEAVATSQ